MSSKGIYDHNSGNNWAHTISPEFPGDVGLPLPGIRSRQSLLAPPWTLQHAWALAKRALGTDFGIAAQQPHTPIGSKCGSLALTAEPTIHCKDSTETLLEESAATSLMSECKCATELMLSLEDRINPQTQES